MAIRASFLNDGTAHNAQTFGAYFNKFVKDGVYTAPANALVVTNPSGLNFRVGIGSVFILGVWIENTSNLTLTADATASQRVDRIVARVDHGVPQGTIAILKGTDGSLTPPQLANSSSKKELCLAEVTITSQGVTAMRDTRSDTELCGFVQNFLGSTDASGLFATWESEFRRVIANAEADIADVVEEAQEVFEAVEAESAGLFGSDGRQGFINPAFHVNQRGLETYSFNIGTIHTFDRWTARIGGRQPSADLQVSRVQEGQRTALKFANQVYSGSGSAGATCILQTIEHGVRTFCNGKKFTVSFDARADAAQRVAVEPIQFATETASGVTVQSQLVSVGTTWQRFSLTFQSTATAAANATDALKIGFFVAWINYLDRFGAVQNATNNIYFANMQINEGDSALPAYIPPMWADVQACRRYFRTSGLCQLVVSGNQTTTNKQCRTQELQFDDMRVAPTFTFYDRNLTQGRASLFTVSGLHADNQAASLSSNRSKGVSLVITNTDVSPIACVLGKWEASAEYLL